MSSQGFCFVSVKFARSLNAASIAIAVCLATTAPAHADNGTLRITSKPGGAQILINGQRQGSSPVAKGQSVAIKLPAGDYTVEAVKAKGLTEQYGKKSVHLDEGSVQAISIDLIERPSASFFSQLKQKFGGRVPQIDMVTVPAGNFDMGSSQRPEERPVHRVRMQAFEMGRTEVTFDEWDACYVNGGCDHFPKDEGWGRGNRPVIHVSWDDAQQFIAWLNQSTGKRYRLPSEAEWEYAARAGTDGKFSVGACLSTAQANYDGKHPLDGCQKGQYREQTTTVGSFSPNAFGLHDMHGNVWEWIQDCWADSYSGAPSDGSARSTGNCNRRVIRGGSWYNGAIYALSARRNYSSPAYRDGAQGFRLAMTKPAP